MAICNRRRPQRDDVRLAWSISNGATARGRDVGYIPQGYGHSIENVGSNQSRMLIGFNTGVYQAIDLSAWIAGNPVDVLATNFGMPASLFEKVPRKDVFISPKK